MNKEPKISLVEKIVMVQIVLIAEVSEGMATLGLAIPVIGPVFPFAAFIVGLTVWAIIIFWLIMKGVSIKWFLAGSGIELIPVINALPMRFAGLIMTFIEDSGPPIVKKAIKTATVVKGK